MKKRSILKRFSLPLLLIGLLSFSSCIIVSDYGPNGKNGKAFFGIDYDFEPPYSYWDNNPSMPNSPFFGEMYRSNPGIYQFEYFVSPFEYWYGTYQIRINPGQPGQPYGEPGRDGQDSYLLLICNEDGFYFDDWTGCNCGYRAIEGDTHIFEIESGRSNFRVEMKKAHVNERAPEGIPKYQLTK